MPYGHASMLLLGEGSEATEPYNKYDKIRPHSIRSLQLDQKVRPLSFRPKNFDLFTATHPVSLSLPQHLDSLSGDPAERMWGMISLSSKGLFSSPTDSFGGQLNLSGALIVTAGVSGGNMGQLASGGCCVNCAPVRT